MAGVQTSLRSAGWVSLFSFAQLIVQFGLQMLLAAWFGAAAEMDAYVAAIALPTVLSAVFVGSLGYAFVPVYSERLTAGPPEEAARLAGSIAAILLLFCGGLAAAVALFAGPLTAVLNPGFAGEQFELTVSLLRILAWLIPLNGLITFFQALCHCHKRFALPALAPVVGTAATLAVALLFGRREITAIGWAVVIGSAVAVLLQVPITAGHLRFGRRGSEHVARYFRLLLPLIGGAAYYRLDPLVDRYLASGLAVGSISYLGYAWRLVSALLMVGTGSLAVVAFPHFVSHLAAGRKVEFRNEVAYAMRALCILIVPMILGLLVYGEPLIHDLFERGEFTPADTRAVARLLALYMGVLGGAAVGEVASRTFYALSDTRTPTVVGAGGFTAGVILKFALVPLAGVAGLVAATSAYYVLNAVVLALLVHRRVGSEAYSGIGGALARSIGASIVTLAAVYPISRLPVPVPTIIAGACGAAIYVALLALLRDEFALRLWRAIRERRRNV